MRVKWSIQLESTLLKWRNTRNLLMCLRNCMKIQVVSWRSYICWLIAASKWAIFNSVSSLLRSTSRSSKMKRLSMNRFKRQWMRWKLRSPKRKRMSRKQEKTNRIGWMWKMREMRNFKVDYLNIVVKLI